MEIKENTDDFTGKHPERKNVIYGILCSCARERHLNRFIHKPVIY